MDSDRIITPFGAESTAAQVIAGINLAGASSPQLEGIGGCYFEDCNEAGVIDSDATDLSDHHHGVAAYALDPGNAKHLWDVSQGMLADVSQPLRA